MKYNFPVSKFENLYSQDSFLKDYFRSSINEEQFKKYESHLLKIGEKSIQSFSNALVADQKPPELLKYNILGERENTIVYDQSYQELRANSYGAGLLSIKFDKEGLNGKDKGIRHLVGFLGGFLFSQADTGLFCPICMTDALARVLEKHLDQEIENKEIVLKSLEGLVTSDLSKHYEGAMFLTERQGGSDVGANEAEAFQEDGKWYLKGHKWFCSNVDAECALVLARMPDSGDGTGGLGLFLFRKSIPLNNSSTFEIIRLKDKLGVRSMASGEVQFDKTEVILLAGEAQGFKMMADMVNMSRLYNAVASLGVARRAIHEAYNWGTQRKAFGKLLSDQPAWRAQFNELASEYYGLFLLTFEAVKSLDADDMGQGDYPKLSRFLTPIVKALCGKFCVFAASESMELIGGNGYIEDSGVPKLLRDAQVLPIWEGTTIIQSLDFLRVLSKEDLKVLDKKIKDLSPTDKSIQDEWRDFNNLLKSLNKDELELNARGLIEKVGRILVKALLQGENFDFSTRKKILEIISSRQSATSPLGAVSPAVSTSSILEYWRA